MHRSVAVSPLVLRTRVLAPSSAHVCTLALPPTPPAAPQMPATINFSVYVDALLTWPGGRVVVLLEHPIKYMQTHTAGDQLVPGVGLRVRNRALEVAGYRHVHVHDPQMTGVQIGCSRFMRELARRLQHIGVPVAAPVTGARASTAQQSDANATVDFSGRAFSVTGTERNGHKRAW